MESEESCDEFVEALPSDRSSAGLMTNGTVSVSPRPMKVEQASAQKEYIIVTTFKFGHKLI